MEIPVNTSGAVEQTVLLTIQGRGISTFQQLLAGASSSIRQRLPIMVEMAAAAHPKDNEMVAELRQVALSCYGIGSAQRVEVMDSEDLLSSLLKLGVNDPAKDPGTALILTELAKICRQKALNEAAACRAEQAQNQYEAWRRQQFWDLLPYIMMIVILLIVLALFGYSLFTFDYSCSGTTLTGRHSRLRLTAAA